MKSLSLGRPGRVAFPTDQQPCRDWIPRRRYSSSPFASEAAESPGLKPRPDAPSLRLEKGLLGKGKSLAGEKPIAAVPPRATARCVPAGWPRSSQASPEGLADSGEHRQAISRWKN